MKYRILIVDDEPGVLSGLKRALRKEPYEILTATSGLDGLNILRKVSVDLVIADQEMPGMSGTEFLSKVCKSYSDTIRFILTGKATVSVAIKAINHGAVSRFFTKPCDIKELAVAIRQALQQKNSKMSAEPLLHTDKQQLAALDQLEKQNPGITEVKRDDNGAIILDDDPQDF